MAANPVPADISGQYFVDCNPAMANPNMYDEALARRLWQQLQPHTRYGVVRRALITGAGASLPKEAVEKLADVRHKLVVRGRNKDG